MAFERIRERVARALAGYSFQELDAQREVLSNMIQEAPWIFGTGQNRLLSEIDPEVISFVMDMQDWEAVGGHYWGGETSEKERLYELRRSRWMYRHDPTSRDAIKLWTAFGFGREVSAVPTDPDGLELWETFWKAPANRPILGTRRVQQLSRKLLVDGEFYFALFVDSRDGFVKIRVFPSEQITEVITLPEDRDIELYYKREWTPTDSRPRVLYYKDALALPEWLREAPLPLGAEKAEDQGGEIGNMPNTDVYMLPVRYHIIDGRGWPLLDVAIPFFNAYRLFLQDRATVARKAAMYTDEWKTKGGTRAVRAVQQFLDTSLNPSDWRERNPSPPAGSDIVYNEMIERRRSDMGTGAGDARWDGAMILGQAATGAGISPHYLGRPDMMQNRAVAETLDRPMLQFWAEYQLFWASIWQDLYEFIVKHSGAAIDDLTMDISYAPVTETPLLEFLQALEIIYDKGLLPARTLTAEILSRQEFAEFDRAAILEQMYGEEARESQRWRMMIDLAAEVLAGDEDAAQILAEEIEELERLNKLKEIEDAIQ
jgi:hypothetical protein